MFLKPTHWFKSFNKHHTTSGCNNLYSEGVYNELSTLIIENMVMSLIQSLLQVLGGETLIQTIAVPNVPPYYISEYLNCTKNEENVPFHLLLVFCTRSITVAYVR